jgi:hypothetical protein
MTSQSKNVSSSSGTGTSTSTRNRSRKAVAGSGAGVNGAEAGVDAGGATKNTRRRIHQKRTRNTNRPKVMEDKLKPPVVSPKPVLESTNPFFIAVCAPESYKPSSSSLSLSATEGRSMNNHRSNGGGGGGGGGGGSGGNRRDIPYQRQKPNVFLRQNNNRNTPSVSSGPGTINHFIHHPMIQNDRQRGDTTVVSGTGGGGAWAGMGMGESCKNNNNISTNIHDNEQFPSLSSSSSSSSEPVTKLNFKEMVLKNAVAASPVVPGAGASLSVSYSIPKVRSEYTQQVPQKVLSTGNIFLGAFYGSRDAEIGGGVDVDDDYEETSERTVSSSALIDSCDRKYDNLYR